MNVGFMFAPGASRATMAATGQAERLAQHVAAYERAGHSVRWLDAPTPGSRHVAALLAPLRHARAYRACDVLRVTSLAGALSALIAHAVHRLPFVISHGADYEGIALLHGQPGQCWKWRALRRLAFARAGAVLVPSWHDAQHLHGTFPFSTIHWLPNWVDLDRFNLPRQPMRSVLFVGRLVVEKNLFPLVEATARLRPETPLLLIGEGPLRPTLARLGARCLGPAAWSSLPMCLAQAGVFCLPSFTEGHPKALLEAMAARVPCVVSPAIQDLITHGQTGMVWDLDQGVDGLRQVLAAVLDSRAPVASMVEAAHATVRPFAYPLIMAREIAIVADAARAR